MPALYAPAAGGSPDKALRRWEGVDLGRERVPIARRRAPIALRRAELSLPGCRKLTSGIGENENE
jgi:hypothetical protein